MVQKAPEDRRRGGEILLSSSSALRTFQSNSDSRTCLNTNTGGKCPPSPPPPRQPKLPRARLTQIFRPVSSGEAWVQALVTGQPHREVSSPTNPPRNIPSSKVQASQRSPPPLKNTFALSPVPQSSFRNHSNSFVSRWNKKEKKSVTLTAAPGGGAGGGGIVRGKAQAEEDREPQNGTRSGSDHESPSELALLSFTAEEVRVFALHTSGGGDLESSKYGQRNVNK